MALLDVMMKRTAGRALMTMHDKGYIRCFVMHGRQVTVAVAVDDASARLDVALNALVAEREAQLRDEAEREARHADTLARWPVIDEPP